MTSERKRQKARQKTIKLMDKIADRKSIYKDVLNQRYADISLGENCGWVESYLIGNCSYCHKHLIIDTEENCPRCGQCLRNNEHTKV